MKYISLILSAVFLFSVTAFTTPVQADEYYDSARHYFEDAGIVKKSSRSKDKNYVNEVEFLKLALENVGFTPDPKSKIAPTPFDNVDPRSWYAPYVRKAYNIGIIDHNADLDPAGTVRLIDALELLLELEGYTIPKIFNEKLTQKDLRSEREKRVAAKALEIGVYTPASKKMFGAQRKLSRRDAMVLMYRFYLIAEADKDVFKQDEIIIKVNGATQTKLEGIEFLESVRNQVFSKYYKSEDLDEEGLMNSAIEGFVKGIGDRYSVYFPPKDSQEFSESLDGTYEGIGAYLEETGDGVVIQTPIKGAPADMAGVRAGDIIIKVNGDDVTGLSMRDVARKIKGPKGTAVTITFLRGNEEVVISIVRQKIEIKSTTATIQEDVLVITMNQFGASTSIEFSDIITEMYKSSLKGIVLDLRANPGGFLATAEDILSYWVPKGSTTVKLQFKNRAQIKSAMENQLLEGVKTAVLIDNGSASASEIVAGTLKDYDYAEVFGKNSFGKGSVQEIIQYRNGGALKVTVAEWLTGKGNPINGIGVSPDQDVEDDDKTPQDEALDTAITWVKGY